MSIAEINKLLEEAEKISSYSNGDSAELKKAKTKSIEALQLVRSMVRQNREDGLLSQLLWGCMSDSGVWKSSDGDYFAVKLEAIENMIRLNPEDNDDAYRESYFEPDYAYEGGLYYYKFSALCDIYYFGTREEGWPESTHGILARKAILSAIELHPECGDFLKDEAKAVDINIQTHSIFPCRP